MRTGLTLTGWPPPKGPLSNRIALTVHYEQTV